MKEPVARRPVPVTSPVPSPSPTPAPAATRKPYERYAVLDLSVAPKIANEFAPKVTGDTSVAVRAGLEYSVLGSRFGRSFGEVDYRQFGYVHPAGSPYVANGTPCGPALAGNSGCVTTIGGGSSAYVTEQHQTESQLALRGTVYGYHHVYIATSQFYKSFDNGYPRLLSTFGFGADILPALERPVSFNASYFYYPELAGTYSPPGGPAQRLRYKLQTFEANVDFQTEKKAFIEVGFYGDHYIGKQNAPDAITHLTAQVGIGYHL